MTILLLNVICGFTVWFDPVRHVERMANSGPMLNPG